MMRPFLVAHISGSGLARSGHIPASPIPASRPSVPSGLSPVIFPHMALGFVERLELRNLAERVQVGVLFRPLHQRGDPWQRLADGANSQL